MGKQQAGAPLPHNAERIKKDVDEFPQFHGNTFPKHGAWNDWPWKLHQIEKKKRSVTLELYNLKDDSMETANLLKHPEYGKRIERMRREPEEWMRSIIRSINGEENYK